MAAIGVEGAGENAGFICGFQHHGAGAIAEQHAGAAIRPVEDAGEHFGTDHQRTLVRTGADELFGDGHRINKAAAHRLYVESGSAIVVAQLVL